jgi:chromosome segregation protein
LTELLSSADIQVSGYNIVPQHAITRLAEVTSEERRKIVEDLVGLGTYDLKKNEAQLQLSQADTNLKIALARVEEVKLRVESLEKERNDFLRHSLLTKEIARLQAQTVSNKILSLDNDLTILRQQFESKESQINNFKAERDRLSTSRLVVEQELRDIREKLMDQGGQKIHELEMSIGEANSEISSLRADIESKKLNLQMLKKQREGLEQDSSQHESELENSRTELTRLNEERNELEEILRRKETEVRRLTDETQTIRNSLADAPKALEGIYRQIEPITTELITISSKI